MPKVVFQQQLFLEVFKASPEQSGLVNRLGLDFNLCRFQYLRPILELGEAEILIFITYFDIRGMCIAWGLEQAQCLLARWEKSFETIESNL